MTVQAAFAIVEIRTPNLHLSTFTSGAEAGKTASSLNETARASGSSTRFRVISLKSAPVSDAWKERETMRFVYGTYKPVPWHAEPWINPNHFAHVSKADPSKLAYTPNPEHGAADRQTRMRPGRYLTQHYSDVLPQDEIRVWCARYTKENSNPKLQFATTPDEIQAVYESGPSSCMGKRANHFDSTQHPTRVYGAGDLAIAWIKKNAESDEDTDIDDIDISARALCWPTKKIYGRIYGDENLLEVLLTEAGFKEGEEGDFDGAKLLRIEEDSGAFIAPYLDDPNISVNDNGKFLILDQYGEINCRETSGLSENSNPYTCDNCDDRCDETYTVDGNQSWCESCYTDHAFNCNDCNETYSGSPYLTTNYSYDICEDCADNYNCCTVCEKYFPANDTEYSEVTGESYCDDCADNMARTPCGELATAPDSCSCSECDRARETPEFELTSDTNPAPSPERLRPIIQSPTSPTINDYRQLTLPLTPEDAAFNAIMQIF